MTQQSILAENAQLHRINQRARDRYHDLCNTIDDLAEKWRSSDRDNAAAFANELLDALRSSNAASLPVPEPPSLPMLCSDQAPHPSHVVFLDETPIFTCVGIASPGEQSATQLCGHPSPFATIGPCTEPAGHVAKYATWHAHLDRAQAMETRWTCSESECAS